nr:hypothetical protein BCU58_23775 [Vibrio sp. 10N.286.48.B7]
MVYFNVCNIKKIDNGVMLLTVSLSLLVINPIMFSQREQFISSCLIVYLSYAISHLYGDRNRLLMLMSAAFTAVALCLKPQYLWVFLFVEVYLWCKLSINSRLPYVSIVISLGFLYIFSVYELNEKYIITIVPWANEYYSSYFKDSSKFIGIAMLLIVTTLPAYTYLRWSSFNNNVLELLLVFFLGAILAFISGRTAFPYHLIPAATFSYLIVNLALVNILLGEKEWKIKKVFIILMSITPLLLWQFPYYSKVPMFDLANAYKRFVNDTQNIDKDMIVSSELLALSNTIDASTTPGDAVIFLASKGMYPHHTIPLHSSLVWSLRLPNFWLLPNAIDNRESSSHSNHIKMIQTVVYEDLRSVSPKVIIREILDDRVKLSDRYIFDVLNERKELRDILYQYKLVATHTYKQSIFEVYVLE